jgi:HNH endonuclease
MTAQERHDAIRRIARDKSLSDAEALRQIAQITKEGGEKLLKRHIKELTRKQNSSKPASEITDRAKRYRAQLRIPAGPKRCTFCGSRKNIDVDHITGSESDEEPENLMPLCRSCNVRKGLVQARHMIGVRTVQFNPHPRISFRGFQNAAAVLLGIRKGNVAHATAVIRSTPPAKRAEYSARMAKNPGPPDFKQYVRAVVIHQRGSHDEGGKIIHATPPALRSEYARQIADIKAGRRGEVPF